MKISPYTSLEWWSGPFAHLLFCLYCYKLFPIAFNCLCFEITVIQSSHVASYLRMNLLWLDNTVYHGISLFVSYCVTMR